MRITFFFSALVASALAVPVIIEPEPGLAALDARQAPAKPKPCEAIVPAPTEEETAARHAKFADAFIYKKNITGAFEFINKSYINHNPLAQNGFDSAWGILSPIWGNQNITPLRFTFKGNMGWVNYRTSQFGEVVDRFRWEDGCIAEHWDQGEKYPTSSF